MRRAGIEPALQPLRPLFLGAASLKEGAGKAAYYRYTTDAVPENGSLNYFIP